MVFYISSRTVSYGCSEGSVSIWLKTLALLFLICINDLPSVLRFCKHVILSDDTQIHLHCEPDDVENAIILLN